MRAYTLHTKHVVRKGFSGDIFWQIPFDVVPTRIQTHLAYY